MTIDAQITRKDDSVHRLSDYGIIVEDFIVTSIPLVDSFSTVEGRGGTIDNGPDYGSRKIEIPITFVADDLHDFPLLRDVIFDLVSSSESFYIREMRRAKYKAYDFVDTNEPANMDEETKNFLVGGKRYLVRISNEFSFEQMSVYGSAVLSFVTTELPFAESVGTTADLDDGGLLYSQELWSYGMGLIHDQESHVYTHTGRDILIYNAGNVAVHPFEQELTITIDKTQSKVTLSNTTTGDTFKYEKPLDGKTLKLEGANVTVNGLQALRDTNKQFISLAPGWNALTLDTSARVKFDFRYYYK